MMVDLHPPILRATLDAAGTRSPGRRRWRSADWSQSRNRLAGIRTRATLASDEAWSAAHRAGARWTRVGGLSSVATGVVPPLTALSIALLGPGEAGTYMAVWTAVFLAGVVALLAAVIRGAMVGNRAAKAVNNPDPLAGRGL